MPRKQYKCHYIYKTTCKITGNYYYGMHSTSNLDDGYLGSGTRLRRSIRKYGIDNHIKEILEYLPNREELKKREAQIVNEELINDTKCMNLQLGGGGGFISEEHILKIHKGASKWIKSKWENPEYKEKMRMVSSIQAKIKHTQKKFRYDTFIGKKHSKESIEKMKLSHQGKQKGSLNSQYGTCWITNGIENKKIHKGDTFPDGFKLGRKLK